MSDPKYPEIEADLSSGISGNTFAIIGRVSKAMRRAGVSKEEIEAFRLEATAADFDHALQTCMKWVNTI